jgi:hypothetical protein
MFWPYPVAEKVEIMLRRTPLRLMSGLALIAFATFAALPSAKAAEAPKLLGKYDDWEAYTYGNGAKQICFALAEPKTQAPKSTSRGEVYFTVTHRPAQKIRNEISMRFGYDYAATSKPFATVGKDKFQMFTGVSEGSNKQGWAWLDKVNQEPEMVKSLRTASSMVIKGKTDDGKLVTDTYSLKGSGAAFDKIDEACK